MKLEKRDGTIVDFDRKKIETAILKASDNIKERKDKISKTKASDIAKEIENYLIETGVDVAKVESIQDDVENALIKYGLIKLAKSYIKYRRDHERMRESKSDLFKAIYSKADATDVQNQNANVDEHSFGGRKGEVTNIIMERLALDMMSEKQRERFLNNEIYPHDKDSYYVGMHNCLSIPDDIILEDGFEVRQTDVRPSNSVSTTGQLIAVTGQIQSLQQFGGIAFTHVDTTFTSSIKKTFNKNYKLVSQIIRNKNVDIPNDTPIESKIYKGNIYNFKKEKAYKYAKQMTEREMYQTCEGLYHNMNTLQSRSGNQLPFSSINYGLDTSPEGRMAIDALLSASISGLGKNHRTSIFPCGIFQLKDGVNNKPGDPNYDLKRKALYSTVRRFYPNYMNGDWSVQVAGIKKDREIKRNVIKNIPMDLRLKLVEIFTKHPEWGERMNIKVSHGSLTVFDDETPTEVASTMGAVTKDSKIVFFENKYAVAKEMSIEEMYEYLKSKCGEENQYNIENNPNKDIDLKDMRAFVLDPYYDDGYHSGDKKVRVFMMNKNKVFGKKYHIVLENGCTLDCTEDHPITLSNGITVRAKDFEIGMEFITKPCENYIERSKIISIEIQDWGDEEYVYDMTTESEHFMVNNIWSHNCRTYNGFDINFTEKYFLSLLKEIAKTEKLPKNYLFSAMQKDGRGNIAPSTIIMPTLAMKARLEVEKDPKLDIVDVFMKKLSEAIDDTRDFLMERYKHICSQKPESARFMYENNVMKGYDPKYGIRSALKHGTLAIGQIGLAETLQILIGKNHLSDEGMKIAIAIESLFKTKCDMFKKEYSLNFGVYYTPAENLCYTAMKKFKKVYGEHPYIKDLIEKKVIRDYFTNSIHVPVWEEIDPYTKIDIETQLTGFSNAGCITYIELDGKIVDNLDAVEQILQYAKEKDAPYIAFNIPADCCLDCGFIGDFQENHVCTKCGSSHVLEPARVTGYLTGDWRYAFNHGKQDEKKDRVKHTKYMNQVHCNCGE